MDFDGKQKNHFIYGDDIANLPVDLDVRDLVYTHKIVLCALFQISCNVDYSW